MGGPVGTSLDRVPYAAVAGGLAVVCWTSGSE